MAQNQRERCSGHLTTLSLAQSCQCVTITKAIIICMRFDTFAKLNIQAKTMRRRFQYAIYALLQKFQVFPTSQKCGHI